MSFIQLPDVTHSELFSLWLDLREISKLDISATNTNFRPNFLSVIAAREVMFDCDFPLTKLLTVWLNTRSIHIRHIHISTGELIDGAIGLKDAICQNVTHIFGDHFTSCNTLVRVINLCPMVTSLCVAGANISYCKVLSMLNSKQHSQLSELGDICCSEYECVSACCSNLTSLPNIQLHNGSKLLMKELLRNNSKLQKLTLSILSDQCTYDPFLSIVAETHPNIANIQYVCDYFTGVYALIQYFDVHIMQFKTQSITTYRDNNYDEFEIHYSNINGIKTIACLSHAEFRHDTFAALRGLNLKTLDFTQYTFIISTSTLVTFLILIKSLTTIYLNSKYSQSFTLKEVYESLPSEIVAEVRSRSVKIYIDDILLID